MRVIILLDKGWQAAPCTLCSEIEQIPQAEQWTEVAMPHIWNLDDPIKEAPYLYRCTLSIADASRPSYLEFGAVAGCCRVWLNGIYLGQHWGGYAKFRMKLNKSLHVGDNQLVVLADNTHTDNYIPFGGDFNNYGGIYREVRLIQTDSCHFDLLYYGTQGLEVHPVSDGTVNLKARVIGNTDNLQVEYCVFDGTQLVCQGYRPADDSEITLNVERPHLWNGKKDPHMYRCCAHLMAGNTCLDEVSLPFGFRSIRLTPDYGFFLNEEHLFLQGVAKHQDRKDCGYVVTAEQQKEDIQLVQEIGANAIRLSHYQHPDATYDLCDEAGLVVWAEVPLLSLPDDKEGMYENAKLQLTELILQQGHHPSICFWGLENEIAMFGETLQMYAKMDKLNQYVKQLDPTRFTTLANVYAVKYNSQLNQITDMVGYNIYYGWYYGKLTDYGPFFDGFHEKNPQTPLVLSEYGTDAILSLHRDDPVAGDYSEEYQCRFHETAYPAVQSRDFLCGGFVWNMFDFGSATRKVADTRGRNRKGLVTYDRKTRKDAFYYYKACWSTEPFVHLTGHRYQRRCGETTTIRVYSNFSQVSLAVNGRPFATQEGHTVFVFENVPLQAGETIITAQAGGLQDMMTLTQVQEPERSYQYDNPNPGFHVENWFTMEQGEEDLFPEDRYSIMDDIGTLLANEEVWNMLRQEIPQITEGRFTKLILYPSLLSKLNAISGQLDEDFVKRLNAKLNTFPKKKQKE